MSEPLKSTDNKLNKLSNHFCWQKYLQSKKKYPEPI